MKITDNRVLILLLERGTPSLRYIRQWLTRSGYVVWHAHDVCHAIEELSDFTVRVRPDVLLLEVPSLPDCFDTLQAAFTLTTNQEVTLLALSDKGEKQYANPYFARNLDQLKSLVRREETRTMSYAA